MSQKEEINQLIDKYEVACYDFSTLKKYQIFAIILFFIGGFVLFVIISNKKRKLFNQKKEIMRKLDALSSELSTEEFLEIKQRMIWAGRQ
jgi:hypothetical protein